MNTKLISKRFLLLFIVLFIFFAILKTIYNYTTATALEKEFIKHQIQTLNSFKMAHRNYYQKLYIDKTIPLNKQTLAGLPAHSAQIISHNFSKHNSFNIIVKTVSDRARNILNKADANELKAIESFNKNPNLKEYLNKEKEYYQYATPIFVEAKCLQCHGKRENAPQLTGKHYSDTAYNYKLGDLRGIVSVKVPTKIVHEYFMSQFFKSLFFDSTVTLIISLLSVYFIRYFKSLNEKLEEEVASRTKALKDSVYTDSLTSLHNRAKFQKILPTLQNPLIALFDIDRFSQTNDFYGSKVGDALIVELSRLFATLVLNKDACYIFRLGGDEFVLLSDNSNERYFIKEVTRILYAINSTPIVIDGNEIPHEVTVAISFEESTELLSTVDIALKHAKLTKKSFIVYNKSLSIEKSYENNMFWSREIKKAIQKDKLLPYYQPIINNHTGKIEKYEALIRLINDKGETISPFFFLEISKHSKQYHNITQAVINHAFKTLDTLEYEFSINLTIEDILDMQMQRYLFDALEKYNIGKRVVFEIVESEGIENFSEINEFIQNVKKYGCKIAIDDFGTGYSNFEYLMKLNADFIKIDGSMIQNLDTNENSRILVSTIVVFAKKLGMKTIAEFVKNETIQNLVVELGIDYSQGYYFGEPQPKPLLGE